MRKARARWNRLRCIAGKKAEGCAPADPRPGHGLATAGSTKDGMMLAKMPVFDMHAGDCAPGMP